MATDISQDDLPHSALRPPGSDPLALIKPSVHLRHSNISRSAGALRHNKKAPLPPAPISVYSRVNRDFRVTAKRGKSNGVSNCARSGNIKSDDLGILPVNEEDRNIPSARYSITSRTSDGFDWLNDDESTVFKVVKC